MIEFQAEAVGLQTLDSGPTYNNQTALNRDFVADQQPHIVFK